jgi:uncharacterized 2Fe-2S/4Fe-4S cluster protein (DUF4445 family)
MEKYKVTFYPDNKSVEVPRDTTLLSAAISAGVYINSACGGDGVCGRCRVILKNGRLLAQPTGLLGSEDKQNGVYLACLSSVISDAEVEVPPEARVDFAKTDASEVEEVEPASAALAEKFATLPLARKIYLELPAPGLEDKLSDLERLYRAIKRRQDLPVLRTNIANIRALGELLRSSDWKVTATLAKRSGSTEIIQIEPGDTSARNFGFCFDIGTTTISGQLIDLNNGNILGTKAAYNKQASMGSDIISRIIYAREPEGLEKLHSLVADGINEIISELIREHGVNLNEVTCVLCAGNTTMLHLLLRIDPTYLRKEPYVPTANFLPVSRSVEAGIKINPHGILACAPGVSSYVGADTTAGVLSSGLDTQEHLSILIDIGTNGEIVLGSREFMVACAASAGPAFEGSGLSCGMRAGMGAIQKVKIEAGGRQVKYETIGNAPPRGICGSGYIDLLAEMLEAGILDKDGKIKALADKRIRDTEMGKEFVIVAAAEAQSSRDIVISESDIDNLKRAKAAIYAATSILCRHMGFSFSDVKKIFIAGGFGTSVDIDSAVSIGLLPDIQRSRFIFVGNSSLSGSRSMLLSYPAREKANEIAGKITYFELSVEAGYMDEYMAALFFPHTDLDKFPSVKI